MILTSKVVRFLHHTKVKYSNSSTKSLLATLRKTTGYTFANCKKALQLNNNDLGAAEKWLQEQAQTMGWSKATKLEGRQTSQGLIGVVLKNSCAALVELNCETDFVAKNVEFKSMVEHAANACVNFALQQQKANGPLTKIWLNTEQLKNLPGKDGKSLSDTLALMIGTVGENATLKRALCLKAAKDIHLSVYAHPSGDDRNDISLGKFGGIVAIKQNEQKDIDISQIGKELCQHIVGMDPKKIGTPDDEPAKEKDDEVCLIHQEYLLDDSVMVKDILEEYGVEIVDFKRFQCGENVFMGGDQPLEYVETCQ